MRELKIKKDGKGKNLSFRQQVFGPQTDFHVRMFFMGLVKRGPSATLGGAAPSLVIFPTLFIHLFTREKPFLWGHLRLHRFDVNITGKRAARVLVACSRAFWALTEHTRETPLFSFCFI